MESEALIPLGYMLKRVPSPPPDGLNAPNVQAVHSLSNCVSDDFGDYINLWRHNGWWLFDSPDAASAAARELGEEPDKFTLFYYEAHPLEFDADSQTWRPFSPEEWPTAVLTPHNPEHSGFDIVTFSVGTSPECSPASCNGMASELGVNAFCLFNSLEGAIAAIEGGAFALAEPGPYRIISVYKITDAAI